MDGCGPAAAAFVDEPLVQLIYRCLSHQNRFVREGGYFACGSICRVLKEESVAL